MRRREKKSSAPTLLAVLAILCGVCAIAYPTLANEWNESRGADVISAYVESVERMDAGNYETERAAAREYNETLAKDNARWVMTDEKRERYESLLDVTGTGIMCYVEIPRIDVELPVYHGTDESTIQVAVGHLEGSSLPVGGPGTHAVLSGHRGLKSARLFTDVAKLREGDEFKIHVLDETLTYEVDLISTVLPTNRDPAAIDPDEDYVSLLTCTPYGVNSHRLFVRGRRVERVETEDEGAPRVPEIRTERRLRTSELRVAIVATALAVVAAASGIYRARHPRYVGKRVKPKRRRKQKGKREA